MEIVADLHLHSKFSRAVSKQMVIPEMAKWAKIKGINLLGTGDWTHPKWLTEIKESLEECGQGVFEIKAQSAKIKAQNHNSKLKTDQTIKFLLTAEISSIYKQDGKTRKIHNLIFSPSFSTVEKINAELKKRGCNLSSDGRPIIGISAKNLAEIVFSVDKKCLIIPAHIWTPWFSMFGANSGFDSIEECFGEFAKNIFAVETGLSSDPEMNWIVSDLDNRQIVSFSDAHSGSKLGREATVFQAQSAKRKDQSQNSKLKTFSYKDIHDALKNDIDANLRIGCTIEFYPEEGKYHWTGHRNCKVIFSPEETSKKGTTCPVCGKRLTPGVMERVRNLGDVGDLRVENNNDEFGVNWIKGIKNGKEKTPFIKLVPLKEIIAEGLKAGVSSKKVEEKYFELIDKLGNEIEILTKVDIGGPAFAEATAGKSEKLAEGIKKVRSGDIYIEPGYDGEFGTVKIWHDGISKENKQKIEQTQFFC